MKNPRTALALTLLLAVFSACESFSNRREGDNCPDCPNNTVCLDSDCGCRPDQHDMGSWCLQKADNLFVAASLDCHCLDVVGLYLVNIAPETGNGSVPASGFSLIGRGNCLGANYNNFSYYKLPDGDSIVIYAVPMPTLNGDYYCRFSDTLRCSADLFGKFHGPDTLEARVVWRRCVDNNGANDGFSETTHLTFTRWK